MKFLSEAMNNNLAGSTAGDFDETLWQHTFGHQVGVLAWDPVGHNIGLSAGGGGGIFGGHKWRPVDKFKQSLVGRMLDYNFFDGPGDEADWNIFIDPKAGDTTFAFILDDVKSAMSDLGDLQRRNGREVVECEITPDENFYINPYFEKTPVRSKLVGELVGVYGPWVRDFGHGGRPEIHPCEIIWFQDRQGDNNRPRWTVLVVQDDSNRFDRKSDFEGTIEHPWSEAPRRAAFSFAVRARKDVRNNYRLAVRRHRNMAVMRGPVTSTDTHLVGTFVEADSFSAPVLPTAVVDVERSISQRRDIDRDDGDTEGTTVVNGRTIPPLEDQTSPGMLDVSLSNIKPGPGPDQVHFFLNCQIQVGVNDRGREGYAEIVLTEEAPSSLHSLPIA